jgi:hypothetical protein
LRGRLAAPRHVFGNAGLTDFDAQFEQFPVDVGRPPKRIVAAHPADQIADFARNRGPTLPPVPDLPGPEQAKSLAMLGDRRRRLHDVQRRAPVAPDPGVGKSKTDDRRQSASAASGQSVSGHQSGGGERCAPTPAQRVSGTSNLVCKGPRTTRSASGNCHLLNRTEFPIGTDTQSCSPLLLLSSEFRGGAATGRRSRRPPERTDERMPGKSRACQSGSVARLVRLRGANNASFQTKAAAGHG